MIIFFKMKTKIHVKKIQNMSQRDIAGFITIPLYCAFHKHVNSKVESNFHYHQS